MYALCETCVRRWFSFFYYNFHQLFIPLHSFSIKSLCFKPFFLAGKLRVDYQNTETQETSSAEFDTVLYAAGRRPVTEKLGLDKAEVKVSASSAKIIANHNDRTTAEHIYALGDCVMGALIA